MNKMASFTRLEFATLKPYNKSLFMYILILILVGTTNDSLSFTFSMVMILLPIIIGITSLIFSCMISIRIYERKDI